MSVEHVSGANAPVEPQVTVSTHTNGHRRLVPMDRQEALDMLGSVSMGRVVFTAQALPAIRPVNHLVDDGSVVIRTHLGSVISSTVDSSRTGVVVAYEADDIDPESHLGWSVVITGMASLVQDSTEIARYEQRLTPWVSEPMDQVIRIMPDLVNGFRLLPDGDS